MRVIMILLLIAFVDAAWADLQAFKLYADKYKKESEVRSVLKKAELAIVQQDDSEIPCQDEEKFGVLYIVEKPEEIKKKNQRLKVIHRWHHPDIIMGKKDFTDETVKLKFGQHYSEPRFAAYRLSKPLLFRTSLSLEVLHNEESLLKHEFSIACDTASKDMRLICEEDLSPGSRIKRSQCKTMNQKEWERESVRQQLRHSNIRSSGSSQ